MSQQFCDVTPLTVALPGPPPLTMSVLDTAATRDSRPTLLCIHGVGGVKEQWLPQLSYFAQGHRVIAPDMRGHGATPATAGPYSMQRITDDLRQLIDARQVRTPLALLAHSYGGVIALELARSHPELVSQIVLIGVAARFNYGLLFKLATMAPVPGWLLEWGRQRFFSRRFHAPAPVMRSLMAQALLPWRGWEQLAEIQQPVLAIAGKLDVVAPPQAVAKMVRELPNARLRVVLRVKHKIHLQRPNATNRIIQRFLEETATEHKP
ncbi:MAG: alpha/beta fold hydrolase [Chloroflexi bacterium]|nr:alpha/beta fold hydrolase [Chloroflexota bacterium]